MKKTMFYLISMLLLASCQKDVIEKKENEEKKEKAPAKSLCDYSQSGTVRFISNVCKSWYIELPDGKLLAPSSSLDDFIHLKYDGAEILFSYELAPFPYDQCNVMPQTVVHIICADLKYNNPKP